MVVRVIENLQTVSAKTVVLPIAQTLSGKTQIAQTLSAQSGVGR